ncbi:MAG: hypothetical protein K5641_05790 [Lachnospiraceae bacterium]|nr:hypothetical protein [Lachnospiraceae bacterium]
MDFGAIQAALSAAKDAISPVTDPIGENISGVFAKACVQVVDMRVLASGGDVEPIDSPNPNGGKGYRLNAGKGITDGMKKFSAGDLTAMVKTAGGPLMDMVNAVQGEDEEATAERKKLLEDADAAYYTSVGGASVKTFWLQFNPSELVMNAQGGGRVQKTSFSEKEGGTGLQFGAADARIDMGVKFYFDSLSLDDAFWGDHLSANATSVSGIAGKQIKKRLGKKRLTVQQKVEGFTAALRSKYTRWVTFTWGSMQYTGLVNNVLAKYTMFDHSGEPVRAEVQLQIVLFDQAAEPYRLGKWEKKYKAAFSSDLDLSNAGQKLMGGLINLAH